MENYKKEWPAISLVVLNYNGLEYLKRSIPSFLNLEYPHYEIMVVDNGSTDGSIEFLKQFKQIRLIENGRNLGYSAGKNVGVRKATTEYILLLDNDILINDREILKKLINYYRSKGNCLLGLAMVNNGKTKTSLYGNYYSSYGLKERRKIDLQKILNFQKDITIAYPHGASMFFNKLVWDYLGGYDQSQPFNIDDDDIGARAWILGIPCYLFHDSYFVHLGIEASAKTKMFCWRFEYFFSGFSRVIFKNYKLVNIIKIYPLFVGFALLKTFKQFISRRDFCVIKSFLFSIKLFLAKLPDTLRQRREIQARRISTEDIFLKIKPPRFD